MSLRISEIDVGPYLHRTLQALNHTAATRDVKLAVTIGEAATMTSDPTLLGRILINMAKNACEASLTGGTVTVSYIVTDEQITFKVHNETAMPKKVQLQVFKRSFSTKGTGRGIGTYSMKLFTEQYLQGKIGFDTSAEEGTTFYAVFPLAFDESDTAR